MKVMKVLLGIVVALFLAVGLMASLAPKPEQKPKQDVEVGLKYSVERSSRSISDETLKKAMDILKESCKPLMSEYVEDIESISVKLYTQYPGDYIYENYGWENQIEVAVKIKQDPAKIPSSYDAWGHTLDFVLGGGARPGYFTSKRPALCGLPKATQSSNVFASVPGLSIIGK